MKRVQRSVISLIMVAIIFVMLPIHSDAKKKAMPKPSEYAAVFNATYYANANPDLKAAYGTDETKLFNHFYNSGMSEGRQGSEEFNVQAYMNRYADLKAAYGSDLKKYYIHYVTSGKAEGRNGRADASASSNPKPAPAPSNNDNLAYQKQIAVTYGEACVVSDYCDIKSQFKNANSPIGYAIAFVDVDGRQCILTVVSYNIISAYSEVYLHYVDTGTYVKDPIGQLDSMYRRTSSRDYARRNAIRTKELQILEYKQKALNGITSVIRDGSNPENGVYYPESVFLKYKY